LKKKFEKKKQKKKKKREKLKFEKKKKQGKESLWITVVIHSVLCMGEQ
jgi:hypothetical protein